MKKTKNKKAESFLLGSVTLKLLIAIICLVILAYLGYLLYNSLIGDQDQKRAEEELEKLQKRIQIYLEQDTQETMNVMFFPPEAGWYFMSFQEGYFPEKQCVGRYESCLCLCKEITCEGFQKEVDPGIASQTTTKTCLNRKCSGLKACTGYQGNLQVIATYTDKTSNTMPQYETKTIIIYPGTIYFEKGKDSETVIDLQVNKQEENILISKLKNEQ
jgi:hypothetical protein